MENQEDQTKIKKSEGLVTHVTITVKSQRWIQFMKIASHVKGLHRGAQAEVIDEALLLWIEKYKKYTN